MWIIINQTRGQVLSLDLPVTSETLLLGLDHPNSLFTETIIKDSSRNKT